MFIFQAKEQLDSPDIKVQLIPAPDPNQNSFAQGKVPIDDSASQVSGERRSQTAERVSFMGDLPSFAGEKVSQSADKHERNSQSSEKQDDAGSVSSRTSKSGVEKDEETN